VQTFVTVWRLKDPDTLIASIVVGTQWTFVILFVGIGFGVQTHPPEKYYATPTPVRLYRMNHLWFSILIFNLTTVLVLDW
jgi:hypothetical protein